MKIFFLNLVTKGDQDRMNKKFITIARKNKNVDFYLTCHAACGELGKFQWFLKNDPNSENEVYLKNENFESFSTDSNWIKDNAENKWLGCHCLLKDDKYTEMICYLSSDILSILLNNSFASISTFNSQGNLGDEYILKNNSTEKGV